jgi:competence protein ComEC
MSNLSVTLIDVGWGDSVFIESQDSNGVFSYALIDSNDESDLRSSYIFLRKYFERKKIEIKNNKNLFDFIILSHAHADHGQGLKAIIRTFGTKNFWYPKSAELGCLADLIQFSTKSSNVEHHEAVNNDKILPNLGDVQMNILWPPWNIIDKQEENNNSIVLVMKLNNVSFVLTGDAQTEIWEQIAYEIPQDTLFFKVPHHGAKNATIGKKKSTPWLDRCPINAVLGISSHVKPFKHPDPNVIKIFDDKQRVYYRTDEQYHLTFHTDGTSLNVKYSHV